MATTISSGTNPYKLGAPPDFGTLYSGRALEFDGVTDYVEVSDHSEHDVGTGDFSISAWIKIDDSTTINSIVSKSTNDDGTAPRWFLRAATNGTLRMNVADTSDDLDLSSTFTVNDGNWHHIVVVVDRGTGATFYKDGGNTEVKANTSGDGNVDNNGKLRIGIYQTSNYFDGKIANLQLWDTILSESDVQYAYTHPEKLITDNSAVTSGTTISNLKAWYPCTEGNPRSPQTTVYDGSEKGLSGELIVDGSFDTAGMSIWSTSGGDSWTIADGVASGNSAVSKFLYQAVFAIGSYYKITYTVKNYVSGNVVISVSDGTETGTQRTANGTYTEYGTVSANANIYWKSNSFNGDLDDVSVKEVKMGNHGTTTFYGDEMHTLSTCTSPTNEADATTGWTNVGFDTFASDTKGDEPAAQGSHSLHLTAGDSGDYCKLASPITLVAGRRYELNITYIINGSGKNLYGKWGSSDGGTEYGANTLNSQSWATATTTITATGTTLYIQIHEVAASDDSDGYIGTLSVKEIGVATGWTTADAEPLIPQTALMGMSKPMVFDGVDDNVSFGEQAASDAAQITMSAWVKIRTTGNAVMAWGECLFEVTTSAINFYPNAGGGGGVTRLEVSTSSVTAGKWHHVVVTRGSDDKGKLYIDGAFIGEDSSLGAIATNNEGSYIGMRDGASNHFDGVINEVSVWGVTFTLAQVQELFNDGVPLSALEHSVYTGTAADLDGYWRNDGTSTWSDRQTVITANPGTPAGSPDTILLPEGTTSGKDILGFPLTDTNNGWLNLSGLEYVDAGDSSVLDIRSAITLEAWIKPAIIDQDGLIIGRYNGTTGAQTYKMYLYTDEYIYFDLYLATSKKETKSTSTVVAGTWYHLVATYDGSHQRLYFNGVLQDEDAETGLIDNDDASFTIGSGTDGATKFNGSIDEVRVYNRALTAFEADGSAPEVGETLTSGEIYKNYKHGLSKHS